MQWDWNLKAHLLQIALSQWFSKDWGAGGILDISFHLIEPVLCNYISYNRVWVYAEEFVGFSYKYHTTHSIKTKGRNNHVVYMDGAKQTKKERKKEQKNENLEK